MSRLVGRPQVDAYFCKKKLLQYQKDVRGGGRPVGVNGLGTSFSKGVVKCLR
jgi:hypothetical protein